jgi:outer membrane receptor protein involved in Fe transport
VLPNTPKVLGNYGIEFDHPGINLSALLNAQYIGRRWTQDWANMHPNPTYGTYLNYGGFTVVDFSLNKRLWDFGEKGGYLYLRVDVNNLFDQDYGFILDYPMPGRNFYVGIGYTF